MKKWFWLLIIFPITGHLILFQKFSINAPLKDNFRVFIKYFANYVSLNDPYSKFQTIFTPENESYPIIMRLIGFGQYYADGNLNFNHILIFCNVLLLALFLVFFFYYFKKSKMEMVAVMSLLLLNPLNYEMYFRTDVTTYQLVTLIISIYILFVASTFTERNKFLKILFFIGFVLSPLGSINGMLANVLVVFCFYTNKEKKVFAISGIIFAIQIFLLWFFRNHGKSISAFDNLFEYNYQLVIAFFMSLGGMFHIISNSLFKSLSAILGFLIFVITFYRLFFPFSIKLNFEKMVFLFCTASLAAIVLLRYNYWIAGYDSVLESRYKIYGFVCIILMFGSFFNSKEHFNLKIFVSYIFCFGLYIIGFYKANHMLEIQKLTQITDGFNVEAGVFEHSFANRYMADSSMKAILEKNKVYSFNPVFTNLNSALKKGKKLDYDEVKIKNVNLDPLQKGDWGGMDKGLQNLTLRGSFPKYNFYFVKIKSKNNQDAVQFLLPPAMSIFNKISFNTEDTISQLSTDYYFHALSPKEPLEIELFGINNLN